MHGIFCLIMVFVGLFWAWIGGLGCYVVICTRGVNLRTGWIPMLAGFGQLVMGLFIVYLAMSAL